MNSLIKIYSILSLLATCSILTLANNPKINDISNETLKPVKLEKVQSHKSSMLPLDFYNSGVGKQLEGKIKEAVKDYTKAINLSSKKPLIRSRAYQNLGVITHQEARKEIIKDPKKALTILSKAKQDYKKSMQLSSGQGNISANMQLLLNDAVKADTIIKKRKEMAKKRALATEIIKKALEKQKLSNNTIDKTDKQKYQIEASKNTDEAHKAVIDYNKVSKEAYSPQDTKLSGEVLKDTDSALKKQYNAKYKEAEQNLIDALKKLTQNQKNKDQNKNNKQKNKDKNKQKNKNDKQKKQDQQKKQKKAEQKTKEALDKQKQANDSKNKEDKKGKQKEANKKTDEAKKAIDDYNKSMKNNEKKKNSEDAEKQIKQAQKNQKDNKPKDAEQDLEKALKNLKKNRENKDSDKDKQKQDQDQQKNKNQEQNKPQSKPKYNKEIDKNQAEALLKMMTKDEKSLKKALKKKQQQAYGTAPVQKDW